MSNHYSQIIYRGLNEKSTEELSEIWITNDQTAWTATAFEVIQEILLERLGELPERPPVTENEPEEEEEQTYESEFARLLAQTALKEDNPKEDNQPVFYSPTQVLRLAKWLPRAAVVSIILTVITSGISALVTFQRLFVAPNPNNPTSTAISWVIAVIIFIIAVIVTAIGCYFPFKAFELILKILMEMEFNSRAPRA